MISRVTAVAFAAVVGGAGLASAAVLTPGTAPVLDGHQIQIEHCADTAGDGTPLTWTPADQCDPAAPQPAEATQPEATEPEAPEATEPEAAEVAEPEATEPAAPETTQPAAPEVAEPEVGEPALPEGTEPEAGETTGPEPVNPDTETAEGGDGDAVVVV